MATEQLNVAVIGVGNMGSDHVQIYAENPSCDLRAVIDVDEDRAIQLSEQYGVDCVETDLEDVIVEESLDAVTIATPEVYHLEPTRTALEHDCHVLLEKPIAEDVEDAKAIGKLVEESDAELTIGYMCRFIPEYAAMKERIDADEFGEILGIQAARIGHIKSYRDAADWSHPMYYVGIHDIDMMRWYMGQEVERVTAEASRGLDGNDTPAVVHTTLRFKDGAVGVLETSWARSMTYPCISTDEIRLTGTDGYGRLINETNDATISTAKGFEYLEPMEYGGQLHGKKHDHYVWEVQHFVDCIKNGESPLITWYDGLKSLEIANAIVDSIERDETVYLE